MVIGESTPFLRGGLGIVMGWVVLGVLWLPDVSALQTHWIPAGYSGGGRFTAVAVDPFDGRRVLVGSDVAGVLLSFDEGESFAPSGQGLTGFTVADIAFSPYEKNLVMVLTDDGLFVSPKGGESWSVVSHDLRYTKRCCTGHLLDFKGNTVFVGTDGGVFKVQRDATGSWQFDRLAGLENHHIRAVAIHYETLFVGTDQGVFAYEGAWTPRNAGFSKNPPDIVDLVSHADGHLYAVEKEAGFFEWGGSQWFHRPVGSVMESLYKVRSFKTLGVDPSDSSRIILGTYPESWPHRVLASQNRGWSWSLMDSFHIHPKAPQNWATAPTGLEAVAFSPQNPKMLFLADWWNIWKSTDAGQFWYSGYNGLQNTVINDIKQHPFNPDILYASAADNGLMISTDQGQTWQRRMSGLPDGHAQELEVSRKNPSKMYILLNPWKKDPGKIYVYRSLDGGNTWRDLSFRATTTTLPQFAYVSGESTSLEIDPESDDIVYVATNGYGIYRTSNGGMSWLPVHSSLPIHYVRGPQGLVCVPDQPGHLYASTLGGGVYHSTDRGEHWQQVFAQEPMTFGLAVSSQPDGVRLVVGCPQKRVAISVDGGRSWRMTELPGQRPEHVATYAVAINPWNPQVILAATAAYDFKPADGVFLSHNGGHSFAYVPMPDNIPRINVLTAVFGSQEKVYIGFNGLGLYKVILY